MLEALSDAVVAKNKEEAEVWTTDRELLAMTAELVHALLLVTLRVHGAKDVGEPLHFPRPWDEERPARAQKPAVSFGQFARQVKKV